MTSWSRAARRPGTSRLSVGRSVIRGSSSCWPDTTCLQNTAEPSFCAAHEPVTSPWPLSRHAQFAPRRPPPSRLGCPAACACICTDSARRAPHPAGCSRPARALRGSVARPVSRSDFVGPFMLSSLRPAALICKMLLGFGSRILLPSHIQEPVTRVWTSQHG